MKETFEANFDGLPGPSHHHGGLSYGNIPSMHYKKHLSHPKKGALQALEKMKFLHDLGMVQGFFPPQQRPRLDVLRAFGFSGNDVEVIQKAAKENLALLSACYSSSSMWAANSATVSPSPDTADGKIHITVANLQNRFHRSIEPSETYSLFRMIFDKNYFTIHPPLINSSQTGDEGAANHIRFCQDYQEKGVHLFVYGKEAFGEEKEFSRKFPPRQSLEVSEAIARRHLLQMEKVVFAKQSQAAIDAGAIHNDVISTGDQTIFLYHENAFEKGDEIANQLAHKMNEMGIASFQTYCISEVDLPLKEAVRTYFFNSQLLTLPSGDKCFLSPLECQELKFPLPFVTSQHFVDLAESMHNGGGPACLRLRIVMNEEEFKGVDQRFIFSKETYEKLKGWIEKYYREELHISDLADPALYHETTSAFDELTQLLHLPPFYPFQKALS